MTVLLSVGGAAALVVLAALLPWLKFVLTIALAKGLAVLGILLLLRAGQVSFGHAMFVAVAAYSVAFIAPRVPDVIPLLLFSAVIAAIAGAVIGLFLARYREIFFGMLNLAVSMVFYALLEKLYHITHGTDGIRIPVLSFAGMSLPRESYEWAMFGLALALAFAGGAFVRVYLASPVGQGLSAIKTRETRLEFAGVSARTTLYLAYVISALLCGAGGAIVAMTTRHVTPLLAYWTASGELVFIAILGGAGSVLGPFLGALAFELIRVYAAASFAEAWQAILGTALLLVILFAPHGLWGVIGGRRRARP